MTYFIQKSVIHDESILQGHNQVGTEKNDIYMCDRLVQQRRRMLHVPLQIFSVAALHSGRTEL